MTANVVNMTLLDRSIYKTEFVGSSQQLRDVWNSLKMVARTDSTVSVCGETSTGKELVAKAIHEESLRERGPYMKINCAAMPAGLLDRGTVRGSRAAGVAAYHAGL